MERDHPHLQIVLSFRVIRNHYFPSQWGFALIPYAVLQNIRNKVKYCHKSCMFVITVI